MATLTGASQTSDVRSELLLAVAKVKQEILEQYEILEKRISVFEEKAANAADNALPDEGRLQQQLNNLERRLRALERSGQSQANPVELSVLPAAATAEQVQATGGHESPMQVASNNVDDNGDAHLDFSGTSSEWALSESIWEASIYIGLPQLGVASSIFTAGLLLLNIVLQIAFCTIVILNFIDDQFSEKDLQGLRAWRISVAHDERYIDKISQSSLVARLCGGDASLELASEQAMKLNLIWGYLPSLNPSVTNSLQKNFDGSVMCILALMMWYLAIAKELGSIFNIVRALICLPTATTQVVTEEGTIRFKTMSMAHKLLMLAFNFARFGIAGILLVTGSLYLAYTSSMQDLLLNAVALEFVMTVDELIFEALAPDRLRDLVAGTAPFQMRPQRRLYGLDAKAMVIPVVLVAALSLVWVTTVSRAIRNLEQANEELCGGALNFAYKQDALGMIHITHLPRFDPHHQRQGPGQEAIREAMRGTPSSEWEYALLGGDQFTQAHDTVEEQAAAIYEYRYTSCHDALTKTKYTPTSNQYYNNSWEPSLIHVYNNQWVVWPKYLQFRFGGSSCAELAGRCYEEVVAVLCPVTCGCNSLMNGQWFKGNCPAFCLRANLALEQNTATCNEDASPLHTERWQIFRSWMESIPEIASFAHDCTTLVSAFPGACLPHEGTLLFSWPAAAATNKIVSYLCPVACDCQFATSTDLLGKCPASCSCPCPVNGQQQESCALSLTLDASGPVAMVKEVSAACCKLLDMLNKAYLAQQQQQLDIVGTCLCKSCHRRCIDAWWAARVSNQSVTVRDGLASSPNQTASQFLRCDNNWWS